MSGLLPDDATPVWCGYRKYEREEMCSATRYSLSCYRIVTTLLPNSRSQQQSQDPRFIETIDQEIAQFKLYNPSTRVAVSSPSRSSTYGDAIPVGGEFRKIDDHTESSVRTVGGERILAIRHDLDSTVVLARDLAETKELISAIGSMLLVIVALGFLLAIFAGMVASKTGMQPISRLKRAVDYVTQTNDLRPIEVVNNDEMAQLTVSFNQMLEALQQSRVQQRQFVTDAGHELKTPLTSMRTNIELLLMMNKSGGGCGISEKDRRDLEDDVMSQMSELSASSVILWIWPVGTPMRKRRSRSL
ncbi:histidine kinase dimerization/phospho-acceptor domain-containing protein [Corynebacterium striatum]|uniref:histidine kinase dimerization/phospho-acceptor domain-containing protein n=1 Tax=Corynebacterium striatum TaxID=43770 RepID=UPI001F186B21|nr:histidine kinase dimerization/phospho-acceptor domain-containing protein [Corynebacterium striatum]